MMGAQIVRIIAVVLIAGTAAEDCPAGTFPFGENCICMFNGASTQLCSKTQDCNSTVGCVCTRSACFCDGVYCSDVNECGETSTGVKKCKCGENPCEDDNICFQKKCYCDRTKFKQCGDNQVCKNKECLCGNRTCSTSENCVKNGENTYFCACGDFWRRCEANEVCTKRGTEYSCKCGTEDCDYGETCVLENGVYTCKCGGNKCRDNESCFKPASGTPFCICGNKGCDTTEDCVEMESKLVCMCGETECLSSSTCLANKTCSSLRKAKCEDVRTDCSSKLNLCYEYDYRAFMAANCAKTCKLCPELCNDEGTSCDTLKSSCNEPAVSQQIGSQCAKTCGLC